MNPANRSGVLTIQNTRKEHYKSPPAPLFLEQIERAKEFRALLSNSTGTLVPPERCMQPAERLYNRSHTKRYVKK